MAIMRVDDLVWWASLRHGGMLISPSRLLEAGKNSEDGKYPGFPISVDPLTESLAGRLRSELSKADTGPDAAAALVTTLLESVCGLTAGRWERGSSVSAEWSRRVSTGDMVRPRRVWLGSNGSVLPVFVDTEQKLGIGRGRRSVTRVVEWLRGGDQRIALITNHRQWRLVYAGIDYDCWAESDASLWFEGGEPGPQVDALRILLSPAALTQVSDSQPSPLMRAILDSRKGEAELSAELGERIRKAVERLIQGCAPALDAIHDKHIATRSADEMTDPSSVDSSPSRFGRGGEVRAGVGSAPADIYRAACRMVMRLVVVLFSEARGLLPVDDPVYNNSYSIGALRFELQRHAPERMRDRHSAWPRLLALFRLVHGGSPHGSFTIPEYGGGLFRPGEASSDDPILRAVALFEGLDPCPNDTAVAEILNLVCVTRTRVRQGRSASWIAAPIDFSDLSSEYIGIIYEGVLDFELRRADDTVLFLNIGDQPALPLTRLEQMDDKALASLFEKLKQKKPDAPDEEDAGESDGEESDSDASDEAADEPELGDAEPEEEDASLSEGLGERGSEDARAAANKRIDEWAKRAAIAGKLVPKPKGKKNAPDYDTLLVRVAKGLIARIVMPGEWYLVRWGGTRKGAGTFYTRPALAVPTVHRTLRPLAYNGPADETGPPALWRPRTPDEILNLKVCDPAMGSGSFLVAALRYLTESLFESLCRHSWIRETDDGVEFQTPPEPRPAWLLEAVKNMPATVEDVKARLKRVVVERCLYGVDLDALAVELGRLALWVETMDYQLPFEFLDHKLKRGNALIGCWFDCFREYPIMAWERDGGDTGHDTAAHSKGSWTKAIKDLRSGRVKTELVAAISPQTTMEADYFQKAPELVHDHAAGVYSTIDDLRTDSVRDRESEYSNLQRDSNYQRVKQAFNIWCSVWFWPADDLESAPMPRSFLRLTPEEEKTLASLVDRHHFFHWELEYPDVFNAQRNGFDAVVGNPPWETLQPNSKEFFSDIDPLYRVYGKQEALQRQKELFAISVDVELSWLDYNAQYKAFSNWMASASNPFGDPQENALVCSLSRTGSENRSLHERWRARRHKYINYAGKGHPFRFQGEGKPYTYKLFLELAHAVLRHDGRIGFIVPSGVYTDKGSTDLRTLLLEHCRWHWLFGFENRDKIFDIDERFKFCPLIVAKGGTTQSVKTAFMRRDVRDWEDADRYALAYPAAQISRFSPTTKAILEIRSRRDAEIMDKVYGNSVLLGDDGSNSWQLQYAQGDFNMTSDSKLFPPRPVWDARGYMPDEYSRWLKVRHVAESAPDEAGWIRLRDGGWVAEDDIEDVALPLYEGRMIGQFDFSQKGWVSGKSRMAVWRDTDWQAKSVGPQYLMSSRDYDSNRSSIRVPKTAIIAICSGTNSRSMTAAAIPDWPTCHVAPILCAELSRHPSPLFVSTVLNSYVLDYVLRARLGGGVMYLSPHLIFQLPGPATNNNLHIETTAVKLSCGHIVFANLWLATTGMSSTVAWKRMWALTSHERLRFRSMLDAIVAELYGIDFDDFVWILRDCDYPIEQINNNAFARALDPKGFWRVDKQQQPELRHTVLTLAAFADLKNTISARGGDRDSGIADFCNQNDGDGWMLPETLRLSDLGLGHDDRARKPQPVRSVMGPRFLPWQLEQTPEESWAECERHARNILGEAGFNKLKAEIAAKNQPQAEQVGGHVLGRAPGYLSLSTGGMPIDAPVEAVAGETDLFGIPVQKDLFGNVVDGKEKRKR